ncbi:vacuolar protein sorting-associated protein 53 homolog [Neocloeon triangulifer]|uniref:vacuolar protein sorting-associated protein 53 homolog n=1 Tax=Neocloeon triangulifer TaxID=2078957 RepID=UPI00286F85CD|nr:vacuolar protein sorting-associated protein 53 homolog [Neocloeon triangulifer]
MEREEDYFEDIESALGATSIIDFPAEVQRAIEQVLPCEDPLAKSDFDAVAYINTLFPTEQSLANLDEVVARMEQKILSIDEDIRTVVRNQSRVGKDGKAALADAQKVIEHLFVQVRDIKMKAEQSEAAVQQITRDIKQLDCAKRNLTSAITALNHLHMLAQGVESLRLLIDKRKYGDIVMPLQGVQQVMEHFKDFTDIPQIRDMAAEVQEIHIRLEKQIVSDFHEAFEGPNAKHFTPNRQLAEACLVVSVLDPRVKEGLLHWLSDLQLAEYKHLFHENQDSAWLDNIERRYSWLKKHLMEFEDKFGPMFPPTWEISERISVRFCEVTRVQLSNVMSRRKHEIDVKLLLFAIQRTTAFENLLAKRFVGMTIQKSGNNNPFEQDDQQGLNPFEEDVAAGGELEAIKAKSAANFNGLIGQCFIPYLNVYIDSIDRNLADLMDQFVQELKISAPPVITEGGAGCAILPSCADLFVFYKKCLLQCTQLSNEQPMVDLAKLFQKYLREYAIRILQNGLPKLCTTSSSLSSMTNLTRDLRDLSSAAGIIQNFSMLLKEGDQVTRYTKEEQAKVCSILTTAEYCLDTTQQLEEKLKERVDPRLVAQIKFSAEQDIFHNVISNCIQLLVQDLEIACEPAFTAMSKIQWNSIESVGDQSGYVTAITGHLKSTIPIIRDNFASSRKYFTQFCIKFINSFIPKLIQNICKCRPLSTVGAEQLLLDTHMFKTVLLDLPSLGSAVNRKPPTAFTKIVVKGMTRAEMILKVVMAPCDPPAAFVEQYIKLLPQSDTTEFQKVLDMKGLRRQDQTAMLELFRQNLQKIQDLYQDAPRDEQRDFTVADSKPTLSMVTSPEHESSRIKKLEKLIKKRL